MIDLHQLLTRASRSRVRNPLQQRAAQALLELKDTACMPWQNLHVSWHKNGWLLRVDSTQETGQVEILIPKDRLQKTEILEDSRADSSVLDYETLFQQGRYYEAGHVAERAIRQANEEFAEDDPRHLPLIADLAAVYMKLAKYHRAEILFEQALEIHQAASRPGDVSFIRLLNDWGVLHYSYHCNSESDFAETESRFRHALSAGEQTLGQEHVEVARILTAYARFRITQFRPEDADDMLGRAMNIREQALGLQHPDVAETLLELARLHAFREEDDLAETKYRLVAEIREKALGSEHPDLAEALFALADHLYRIGDQQAEACELLNRALDIWERTLGLEHPLVEQEGEFIKQVLARLQQSEESGESEDDDDEEYDDDVEF